VAAEKDATDKALAALRGKAAADRDALRAGHAKARGELIAQQQQELAEIETKLATERRSLQRQLDTSLEVIALQKSLTSALAERQAGSETLLAAFEAARKSRRDFIARLPTEWAGTVKCTENGGEKRVWRWTSSLTIQSVQSEGFTGRIHEKNSGSDITFVLSHDALSFPLAFHAAVISRSGVTKSIDFALTSSGKFVGQGSVTWNMDNREVAVSCEYELSS